MAQEMEESIYSAHRCAAVIAGDFIYLAVGSGQWAVGSGQWAVGSGQWAVGSGLGEAIR
jgi:hypothetical protein